MMGVIHAKTKRWTREEYQALADSTALNPKERLELIEGEIVAVSPQGCRHAAAVRRLNRVLFETFGHSHEIAVQCSFDLSPWSQPEPDFALIPREADPGAASLPDRADLLIEIAVTSLAYDRNEKCSIYAKAGIPEVWILNDAERCLEVYLSPVGDAGAVFGHRYAEMTTYGVGAHVSPWWSKDARVPVARLVGEA